MSRPLDLDLDRIEIDPRDHLASVGEIFATFDERTQDSGNVSWGVRVGDERLFVKTAGRPDDSAVALDHAERVAALRNAVRLARICDHPALPDLLRVIESPTGPMLVYRWVDGELLYADSARRRFRALPPEEALRALDAIYEAHAALALHGWIAVDLRDGSMIYDFDAREIHLVDLDLYHEGPLVNEMGRMFGSTRFMAPEEFRRGATIDERTTVYSLGRCARVLLPEGSLDGELERVVDRACRPEPSGRHPSVEAFVDAWRTSRDDC